MRPAQNEEVERGKGMQHLDDLRKTMDPTSSLEFSTIKAHGCSFSLNSVETELLLLITTDFF